MAWHKYYWIPPHPQNGQWPDASFYMGLIGSADIAAAALTAAMTAFIEHIITEAVCGQEKIHTHCV